MKVPAGFKWPKFLGSRKKGLGLYDTYLEYHKSNMRKLRMNELNREHYARWLDQ